MCCPNYSAASHRMQSRHGHKLSADNRHRCGSRKRSRVASGDFPRWPNESSTIRSIINCSRSDSAESTLEIPTVTIQSVAAGSDQLRITALYAARSVIGPTMVVVPNPRQQWFLRLHCSETAGRTFSAPASICPRFATRLRGKGGRRELFGNGSLNGDYQESKHLPTGSWLR